MKLGLKIGVALLPIPFVYFVFKDSSRWWTKIIPTLWAMFWGAMLMTSFVDGLPTSKDMAMLAVLSLLAFIVVLVIQIFKLTYQQTLEEQEQDKFSNLELDKEYAITYCDSKGQISERNIIARGIESKNGESYLQAVCLLRNSSRTFKVSNVISMHDVETGEVVL